MHLAENGIEKKMITEYRGQLEHGPMASGNVGLPVRCTHSSGGGLKVGVIREHFGKGVCVAFIADVRHL